MSAMPPRMITISRQTSETRIVVRLGVGDARGTITTGIPFLGHGDFVQWTRIFGAVAPQVVGSRVSPTVLPGLNQVSMNLVVLQKDMAKLSAHLNETSFALSLACNAGADSLTIDVPYFTFGGADVSPMSTAGGARTVTLAIPAALVGRDPTIGTMIKFTRSNI